MAPASGVQASSRRAGDGASRLGRLYDDGRHRVSSMFLRLADARMVTTVAVTDLARVEFTTRPDDDLIAQIGPARGAWFSDDDGNVFGVREGPVPGGA